MIGESGHVVLATSKSGLIAAGIRWFSQGEFSHCFITMPSVLSFPMCIEAMPGGVDYNRFDKAYINNLDAKYEVWHVKLDESVKEAAMKSVLDDLEVGYGFLEYPWFGWRRLNSMFGRDIKSQDNWHVAGMICSQMCVAYLTACGLGYVFAGYGKGSMWPQDLSVIFRAHPEVFELIQSVRM